MSIEEQRGEAAPNPYARLRVWGAYRPGGFGAFTFALGEPVVGSEAEGPLDAGEGRFALGPAGANLSGREVGEMRGYDLAYFAEPLSSRAEDGGPPLFWFVRESEQRVVDSAERLLKALGGFARERVRYGAGGAFYPVKRGPAEELARAAWSLSLGAADAELALETASAGERDGTPATSGNVNVLLYSARLRALALRNLPPADGRARAHLAYHRGPNYAAEVALYASALEALAPKGEAP